MKDALDEEYDMIFKVVIIGDSGVGKSNIMSRYLRNEFALDTKATVGVEFGAKKLEIEGFTIKAQIWDTAGQERYKSIANVYYKGSKGAFVVYDISRKDSFESLDRWVNELRNNGGKDVIIILIGNKCDLEDNREVSKEIGMEKAKDLGCAFFETSARMAINVEDAFKSMSNEIFKQMKSQFDEKDESDNVVIGSAQSLQPEKKKKGCC